MSVKNRLETFLSDYIKLNELRKPRKVLGTPRLQHNRRKMFRCKNTRPCVAEFDTRGLGQSFISQRVENGQERASKRVGGGLKKVVKRAIDPSEAEVEEAIEAILTPTHADTLETLLNEPFAGALHKARTDRNAQV